MADEKAHPNEHKQKLDDSKRSLEDNQRLLRWVKNNLAGDFKKDVANENDKLSKKLTGEIRDSGKKTRADVHETIGSTMGETLHSERPDQQQSTESHGGHFTEDGDTPPPRHTEESTSTDDSDTPVNRARMRRAKTTAERLLREQGKRNQNIEAEGNKGHVASKASLSITRRIDSIIKDLRSQNITRAGIAHYRIVLRNIEQDIHKNIPQGPAQNDVFKILGRAYKIANEAEGKFGLSAKNAAKHIAKQFNFNRNNVIGAFVGPNIAKLLTGAADLAFGSSAEKKEAADLKRARETEQLMGSKQHAEQFAPKSKRLDPRYNSAEDAVRDLQFHDREPALDALHYIGPEGFKTPEHHQHAIDAILKRAPDTKKSDGDFRARQTTSQSKSARPARADRRPNSYSVKNVLKDWETNENPTEEQIKTVQNEFAYQYHGVAYSELIASDKPGVDKQVNGLKKAKNAKEDAESSTEAQEAAQSITSPKPEETESAAPPTPETPKAEPNAASTAPPTPSKEQPTRLSPDALKKAEESRYNDAIALAKKSGGNLRHSELRSGLNLDFQTTTALYDRLQKDGHLGTEDGVKSQVATKTTNGLPPEPSKTPVAEDVSRGLPLTINEQLRASVQKRRDAVETPSVALPEPTPKTAQVETIESLVRPLAKKKRAVRTTRAKAQPKAEVPASPTTPEIPIVPYITPLVTGGIKKPIFGEKPIAQKRRGKKVSENQTSFFPIENSPKRVAKLAAPASEPKALKMSDTLARIALSAVTGKAVSPITRAVEGAIIEPNVAQSAEGTVVSKATSPIRETIESKVNDHVTSKVAEKLGNKPEERKPDSSQIETIDPHSNAPEQLNAPQEDRNTNAPVKMASEAASTPISAPGIAPEQSGSSPARMDEMAKGFAGLHHDLTRLEKLTEAQLNELKEIAKNSARDDEEDHLAADAERRKGHETEVRSHDDEKEVAKKAGGGLIQTLLTGLLADKVFGGLLRKLGIGAKAGEVVEAGGVTKKTGGIFSRIKEKFGLGKAGEGIEAAKGTEGIAKAEGFMGRVVGGAENVAGGVKVASKVASGGAEVAKGAEGLAAIAEASSFMGKLSKFTGITKLLGLGRLAGKIFLPLTILMSVFDFFSGFSHAGEILGKKGKLDVMDRVAGGVGGIVKGLVSVIDLVLGFIGIKSNIAGVMGKVVGRTISGLMHVVGASVKPIFHILTIAGKLIGMALKPILTGIKIFAKIVGMIPWDKIADQIEAGLKPLEDIFDMLDKAVDAFSKSVDWLFGAGESPFDGASKALNGIKEFLEKLALLNPVTLFNKGWGAVKSFVVGGASKGGSTSTTTATGAADKGTKPAPAAAQPSIWEKTKSLFGVDSTTTTTASNSPQKLGTASPSAGSTQAGSTQTASSPGDSSPAVMSSSGTSSGAPATPHVQTPFEHFTSRISEGFQSLFSPKKEETSSSSPTKTGAQSADNNSPITSAKKTSEYARIGSVSAKLEAGGDAGTVNSAKAAAADNGGRSYGSYQMTTRDSKNPTGGTMKSFMNYLSTNNPEAAKKLEAAGGIQAAIAGDPKFISTFKELAKSDPKFADNQHAFIGQTHYEPAAAAANKMGANIDQRGDGVKQMIFSTAVNMGGANKVMKNAFKGMSPEQISKLSDQEFIQKYQAEKINNTTAYYSNPQSAAQNNARFRRETSMFLNPDQTGGDKNVLAGNSPRQQSASPGFPPKTTEVAQSANAARSMGGSITGHMVPIPEHEHERKMASVIQGTLVNTAYMGKYAKAAAGISEDNATTKPIESMSASNYGNMGRPMSPHAEAPSADVSGTRLQQASADNSSMKAESMKSSGHTANISAPTSNVNHNTTQTGPTAKAKNVEDTYQRQMNQVYVLT